MRLRLPLLISLLAVVLVAASAPSSAFAKPRMLVGVQDDPSLRWRPDRRAAFKLAQRVNVGIVRTTVYWSRIAPTRPRNAANPFDRAYRFSDLDEFVRNAGLHGMEVMLTIWGTPKWANHGKGENHAPSKLADLRKFAQALAARYSGRRPGYPFVRYFTVWNESNLGLFLSPQYNPRTKRPVAPKIYAAIYRAAYAGIKAGNPRALVGIGETSARGRDRYLGQKGVQETESPGRFAKLLAQQRPRLKFDAWSHHPYPTTLRQKPSQRVQWPNVTLSKVPAFADALRGLFKRDVPIWITEYGYQTRPAKPGGVTSAQQSTYLRQALDFAAGEPSVDMFIWFILRDDPTSDWKSGLVSRNGKKKPAFATFAKRAAAYDGREPQITLEPGAQYPLVRFGALELWSRSGTGAKVGLTVTVYRQITNRRLGLVRTAQPVARIGYDGWISFHVPLARASARVYSVNVRAADIHGNKINRSVLLHVKPAPVRKKKR